MSSKKTVVIDGAYIVIDFRCRTCGCVFRCGIADCDTKIVMVDSSGANYVSCETDCPNCNVSCCELHVGA
jgi:hypothetical protein